MRRCTRSHWTRPTTRRRVLASEGCWPRPRRGRSISPTSSGRLGPAGGTPRHRRTNSPGARPGSRGPTRRSPRNPTRPRDPPTTAPSRPEGGEQTAPAAHRLPAGSTNAGYMGACPTGWYWYSSRPQEPHFDRAPRTDLLPPGRIDSERGQAVLRELEVRGVYREQVFGGLLFICVPPDLDLDPTAW